MYSLLFISLIGKALFLWLFDQTYQEHCADHKSDRNGKRDERIRYEACDDIGNKTYARRGQRIRQLG